ncbi:MAG: hypothetical protein IB617_02150 [Candidatus Nealsonbacteria bacterium]|nr:MAG: hypothetical protein IB617_02150 [Candidatus Nealsonbacteria bacterium]
MTTKFCTGCNKEKEIIKTVKEKNTTTHFLSCGHKFVEVVLQDSVNVKSSIQMRMKRGEKSWNYIYYTFSVLLAVFSFIIGIGNIWWVYKVFIFIIGAFFLYWLCFCSAWFQNKIIGFKIKLENTWRKL